MKQYNQQLLQIMELTEKVVEKLKVTNEVEKLREKITLKDAIAILPVLPTTIHTNTATAILPGMDTGMDIIGIDAIGVDTTGMDNTGIEIG